MFYVWKETVLSTVTFNDSAQVKHELKVIDQNQIGFNTVECKSKLRTISVWERLEKWLKSKNILVTAKNDGLLKIVYIEMYTENNVKM